MTRVDTRAITHQPCRVLACFEWFWLNGWNNADAPVSPEPESAPKPGARSNTLGREDMEPQINANGRIVTPVCSGAHPRSSVVGYVNEPRTPVIDHAASQTEEQSPLETGTELRGQHAIAATS
ncbi:hypothetical protein Rcae01_06699 [Novipirellula caenicola]|uniref:Uncharacterized protein n=1 Tax=Novipirellula caenicola TaxID=1536901 RepID=A0ABP9W1F6_9BACT